MTILIRIRLIAMIIILVLADGCRQTSVPKPKGFFRIDLPEKEYITFDGEKSEIPIPVAFEYPAYGHLSLDKEFANEPGWFNIEFPPYNARIYLTYKNVNNDFTSLMEQTYKMNVKNHVSKADAINEQAFNNENERVYGILYNLKGNTASAVQFYVTDSVSHYLRGSLYFSSEPNADSLAPVIDFFRDDIIHLVETLKWK
jgi:gliding motility-associated lipoprotein GldD